LQSPPPTLSIYQYNTLYFWKAKWCSPIVSAGVEYGGAERAESGEHVANLGSIVKGNLKDGGSIVVKLRCMLSV